MRLNKFDNNICSYYIYFWVTWLCILFVYLYIPTTSAAHCLWRNIVSICSAKRMFLLFLLIREHGISTNNIHLIHKNVCTLYCRRTSIQCLRVYMLWAVINRVLAHRCQFANSFLLFVIKSQLGFLYVAS